MPTDTSTPWLTPNEMRAWRHYIDAQSHLMAALSDDLAAFDLTLGDYEVLAYLSESAGEQMRMCDLAAELRLSASGLTRRLDGLVRRGAVERQASNEDRRVMLATLTADGRQLLHDAAPTHVDSVRRHLIDLLSTEQISVLGDIFTIVSNQVRRRQNECR
jgi:DNA-binding MarR family transcriptional regulator